MNEKISIIVTVYNIREYLSQCLDSVCNQTYKNIEIVLVDDGSTDGSEIICDNYALKDDRIHLIHKENEGLVAARKAGLKSASGKYISYIDGDDWVEQSMIEKLWNALSVYNADITMCGRFEETGDFQKPVFHGIAEGRYDKQRLVNEVFPKMLVNGAFFEWGIFPSLWDKLFKRECIERYQNEVDNRLTMGEDAACVYPALLNANSIYILHECLYHYRQSTNSMVKKIEEYGLQRKRFHILYNSVYCSFEKSKSVYDMREQWKEYVLFLMIPRAYFLYEGYDSLEYLFPFRNVRRDDKILIYGMGTFGQLLYKYIMESTFCKIVACVDKNYKAINKMGFNVVAPEEIENYDFDGIVIANSFANVRNSVYDYLSKKISKEKIHIMDEELIFSNHTLIKFGLIPPGGDI